MPVKTFMSTNLTAIQQIISELPRPFDSHTFIKTFSHRFQVEYVSLLHNYETEPFLNVHAQIGRFLSENQSVLGITKRGKVSSENVFGLKTDNEQWV